MKTIFTFFITFLMLQIFVAQGTYTEEQRRRDQTKLDSICKKSPNSCLYYDDAIGPKSVFRNHAPRKINRTQKICFDKKLEYMATINGKTKRGCYYMNSVTGYVAQFLTNLNESCNGMNNPQPGFEMMITSKVGESFTFKINKRGERTFYAEMPPEGVPYGMSTNFVLKNPRALSLDYREPFTNLNLPTLGYVIEGIGESSTKYLFGVYHAQRIPLKDYVGAFGTGYYKDGMGNTFICLAVESENNFVKIEKITDVTECFDGSLFKDGVEEALQSNEETIREREKDLDYQDNLEYGKTCEATTALVQHKRQVLNKEKSYHNFIKSGGNPNSKDGLRLGAMAQDVTDQVVTHRLETEKRICAAEYSIQVASREYNGAKAKERASKKIACYSIAVKQLDELQKSLTAINVRHGSNYAKALAEKNMLYLSKMRSIDTNCNQDKAGNTKKNPMEDGAKQLGEQLKEMIKRK
ncbi:hypothetical protein MQX03_07280 [Chryseobacterium aahli]|uniref:hypothetical protein n=1 Tax=Chryseobacterium aahli TaxID=1278643 RepID=UPI001F622BA5|nr:hypothetical protein [Chryseobacterium aahli]MCI3936996.1 hypothetical protein [Chryseobacterium aahli]